MSADPRLQADVTMYKKQGIMPFIGDSKRIQEIQAEIARRKTVGNAPVYGITLANPGTVGGVVGDIISGRTPSRIIGQLNPEQQRQIKVYNLNQEARSGKLSVEQYQNKLTEIEGRTAELQAERSERFGRIATVKGRSETAKQDEARAIAAQQGVALGTISSSGQATSSQNSKVSQVTGVNQFVQAQKQSMAQVQQTQIKARNTGIGTTTDPFKAMQPNLNLVSPFLKTIQGPPQKPSYHYLVELFEGGKKQEILGGSLDFIYGKKNDKITAQREKDNPLQNFGASLWDTLRYYDRVENKEVEKPKGLEFLPYYASKGVSVLSNIPLNLMGDKKITPTLSDTIFDTGFQLVTTGKTKTHDPIGDYIKKDPIGTLVQLPAEGLLLVGGAKVFSLASQGVKKYSPIAYQSEKILTSSGKVATTIRSITFQDKPVVSLQSGKIIKGFDPKIYPYEKINVGTREGFEAALGSGFEKSIYYSPKALQEQVSRGIIPEIAKTRSDAWINAVSKGIGSSPKQGILGTTPIKDLTQRQTDYLFEGVKKGQKEGTIDLLHGSPATRAGVPESVQKQAGSALQLGDIDITPKGKNLTKIADKLIQGFAQDFPLSPGQRLSIKNVGAGENVNRALQLTDPSWKEPKKVLEVVLRTSDQSKQGIPKGSKILGYNIPLKKSLKVTDYGVKTNIADYQLLTNVKQVLAYQKGSKTLFDIYTSSGRTKDIVRGYWNLKGKAIFKSNQDLDKQADYIRSLYPGLEFTDVKPEKILLSAAKIESKADSITKGSAVNIKNMITPREKAENKNPPDSSQVISSRNVFSSRNVISSRNVFSSKNVDSSRNMFSSKNIASSRDVFSSSMSSGDSFRSITGSSRSGRSPSFGRPSQGKEPRITSLVGPPGKPTTSITTPPSLIGPPGKVPPGKPPPSLTGPTSKNANISSSLLYNAKKKIPVVFMPNILNTTKKAPGNKKITYNFLGSSRVAEITGFRTKKSDITVGDKKTRRLYDEDLEKSRKKFYGLTGKKKNIRL